MKEKHEKKKGPINKKQKFFRQSFCFEKKWSEKCKFFFFEKRETRRKREHKGHFSLLRTNKQETLFSEKEPVQTEPNQKQHGFFFLKKREYATEEKTKGEKNDDQTEQSPQKKRYMKNGSNRGKTFKNENKKETCSKTNENKSKRKNRSKKEGQTCKT